MKISKYFLVILLLIARISLAQDEEGGVIGESWFGGPKSAPNLYSKSAFHDAIPLYEKSLEKKPDSLYMAQLGDCYRFTGNYVKASQWYSKAVLCDTVNACYTLIYGQTLQTLGKTEQAKLAYQTYLQKVPNSEIAKNQIQAIDNIKDFSKAKERYTITNLSFNSPGYDLAPIYKDGKIYYSSSRDVEKAIGKVHSWTGTTFFDMYTSKGKGVKFDQNPEVVKELGAGKLHDAAPTYAPDGIIYYTRNNTDLKEGKCIECFVDLQIFSANEENGKWINEKPFPFNSNDYSVGHPALTPDGNTMYFVSNKPGGKGGTDLYVTTKNGDTWSEPINLEQINTEGNEMFPYVDKTGNLFFSSTGHPGMGGLDIFRVRRLSNTSFSEPENIGAPINSSYDDYGFTYADTKEYGYFTSNRPKGKGLEDIYGFHSRGIFLEGIVVDAETDEPICTSTINMFAYENLEGTKTTDCDGFFTFNIQEGKEYCFKATAENYFPSADTCITPNVPKGETMYVKIPLKKIKPTDLKVQIIDKKSKEVVPAPEITVTDKCDETAQKLTGNKEGEACFTVKCDCDYVVLGVANGYLPNTTETSTKNNCNLVVKCGNNGVKTVTVELERGPNWKDYYYSNDEIFIEIKDIYYDFDKWDIRKESEEQLNKLVAFMEENPTAILEIGSHTDARAPHKYNEVLSQKRAQSVIDWLVQRNIDPSRLVAKGYGETKPRNKCVDKVKCTEEEHQRNRRTEFRVVAGDFTMKSLERFDIKIDPCKKCPF